jgi:hypothetical protein
MRPHTLRSVARVAHRASSLPDEVGSLPSLRWTREKEDHGQMSNGSISGMDLRNEMCWANEKGDL